MNTSTLANIWFSSVAAVVVTAAMVALSLLVRRRAPEGGYFSDSDRAAAVFGSIGGLFSVLLALVVFLSVQTYSETQSHANAEADAVLEQFQIANLFPSRAQYGIQSQLICYGRSVRDLEWPLMERNEDSPTVVGWASSIDQTMDKIAVSGAGAEAGFRLFLEQALNRQEERRGRLEGAAGDRKSTRLNSSHT